MDTMLGMYGIRTTPFTYEINRCELYANTAENEKPHRLIPLSALGREIL